MSALPSKLTDAPKNGLPRYELRTANHGPDNLELEVWQLPASATPHIKTRRGYLRCMAMPSQ